MHVRRLFCLCLAWLCVLPVAVLAAGAQEVAVGVLAHRGVDTAVRMWTPTIDYLGGRVSGYGFRLLPLDLQQMRAALVAGELDFILTNPGHYVELEAGFGVTRIATLMNIRQGRAFKVFGAVIFTRAGREDIQTLADLRGKIFGAVDEGAFGGFQMAWRELKEAGIDPFRDFGELRFSGFPQDNIVLDVRDGRLDAGTVRSDVLEGMAGQGVIELADFRVLSPQTADGFPFLHSTRLYPEWAFARARSTPDALASKVSIALLQMPAGHPAARAGDYAGWTVPLSYQPVHDLFMQLGIGPYARPSRFTLLDAVRRYWYWVALMALVILFSTSFNILVKRQVDRRTAELTREVAERKHAEEETRMLLGENRVLVQKSMAVQEDERRHLARELHDEFGQCITAIQADARIISERAPAGDSHIGTSAGAIQDVAAHLYNVVHSMMQRLRPEMLDDLGLPETLRAEVDAWRARQPDTVYELDVDDQLPELGEELNITLYRIVQECLTNIAKYARARHVTVRLAVADVVPDHTPAQDRRGGVRLLIQDDGAGFDPAACRPGLGLVGMRERVEGLRGHFSMTSTPGGGTTVSVELPLTSTASGA
jgi:two-component system sensor histidine kinase TtrS